MVDVVARSTGRVASWETVWEREDAKKESAAIPVGQIPKSNTDKIIMKQIPLICLARNIKTPLSYTFLV